MPSMMSRARLGCSGLSTAQKCPSAMVSASTWAVRVQLSKANSGSSLQVREPQKRKPSRRTSVVTAAALSRPASVAGFCRSQYTSLLRPVTPLTPTLDRVLCQPICSSILARRPSARATAEAGAEALASGSQLTKSGQIVISSRALKFCRYAMASETVSQCRWQPARL